VIADVAIDDGHEALMAAESLGPTAAKVVDHND
jgi:hypothetical protein